MLKSEIMGVKAILNDVKKHLENSDGAVPLKTLRQELKTDHQEMKINYVLDLLINEESHIAEKIRTPFDQFF